MPESVIIGIVSAVVLMLSSVLLLWMARAGARGSLPRNQTIGIRTKHTMVSDEAWIAGHRAGAARTRIAAIGSIVGGALGVIGGCTALVGASETLANGFAAGGILAAAAWLIVWVLAASKAANRAARAVV